MQARENGANGITKGYLPIWPSGSREFAADDLAKATVEANRLIRGGLARTLGHISVAPVRYREHAFNGLCLTSMPLPAFGGASFWLNTGSSSPDVPAGFLVRDIPHAARLFYENVRTISSLAPEARAIAEEIIAMGSELHPPARLLTVGIVAGRTRDEYRTVLTLEMLGDGLAMGPETVQAASRDLDELRSRLEVLQADHVRRARLLAAHREKGALGLIDQTASRIMDVAGMTLKSALAGVGRCGVFQFRFDGGRMVGSLEWKEDVLTGNVFEPNNAGYLWESTFTFWQPLPETIRLALVGRPLSAVVERPYFPSDAVITAVGDFGQGGTRLDLDIPTEELRAGGTEYASCA